MTLSHRHNFVVDRVKIKMITKCEFNTTPTYRKQTQQDTFLLAHAPIFDHILFGLQVFWQSPKRSLMGQRYAQVAFLETSNNSLVYIYAEASPGNNYHENVVYAIKKFPPV